MAGLGGKTGTLLHADSELPPRSSQRLMNPMCTPLRSNQVCTSLTIEVDESQLAAAARRRKRAVLVHGNGGWASMFAARRPTGF